MKQFIIDADDTKKRNSVLPLGLFLNEQNKSSIVVQCHVLEGYRPITDTEMYKYEAPSEAMYFYDQCYKPYRSSVWITNAPSFIPIDFEFEQKKELTDEDAKLRPMVRAWQSGYKEHSRKGVLIYFTNGKYLVDTFKFGIGTFDNCELIEEEPNA